MDDLVEFLRARLDELEREATIGPRLLQTLASGSPDPTLREVAGQQDALWCRRVLADVEAKRRIVEQYDEAVRLYERLDKDDDDQKWEWLARSEALEGVLRLLALAAADHPDYDERWRPTT